MRPLNSALPCRFQIGEQAWIKVSPGEGPGIVTEIKFCADGGIVYYVSSRSGTSSRYDIELADSRDGCINEFENKLE